MAGLLIIALAAKMKPGPTIHREWSELVECKQCHKKSGKAWSRDYAVKTTDMSTMLISFKLLCPGQNYYYANYVLVNFWYISWVMALKYTAIIIVTVSHITSVVSDIMQIEGVTIVIKFFYNSLEITDICKGNSKDSSLYSLIYCLCASIFHDKW